ncbi:PREDICTED: uncharacterized protein LOC107193440 [Dufourea novaeangliae]|uniref:uncharacterized protein LOC107193440 n=1 Tax=Dufourea novaeangliae TaxID=178035 RepID=UPI000766E881|nr:PREDICTED: uncharacterized protein LOC107193440 [Dufourea novaeangliae]
MDRIRTNIVCHCLLLVVCISHASTNDNRHRVGRSTEASESEKNSEAFTALQTYRYPRAYRRGYQDDDYGDDHHDDHHDHEIIKEENKEMKAMSEPKVDYWGGYYDFLINEGSYKFWAVFQLATAALLIYSGFAALYYAKVNPPTTDDEFDDIFRRRRRRSLFVKPQEKPFCGLDSVTFQRILDAVAKEIH